MGKTKQKFAPIPEDARSNSISSEEYEKLGPEMFDVNAPAEDSSEKIVRESTTYWQDVWRRFRRDPLAMIGLCVILVMTLSCIFIPMFSDYTYSGMDLTNMNAGPSLKHLCGTDQMGRDLFIRVLYGARISLAIGVVLGCL